MASALKYRSILMLKIPSNAENRRIDHMETAGVIIGLLLQLLWSVGTKIIHYTQVYQPPRPKHGFSAQISLDSGAQNTAKSPIHRIEHNNYGDRKNAPRVTLVTSLGLRSKTLRYPAVPPRTLSCWGFLHLFLPRGTGSKSYCI